VWTHSSPGRVYVPDERAAMSVIRTVIAHPYSGNLYGSPYLFHNASYNFTHAYSNANLARDGWRMVELDELSDALRPDAAILTPGEYTDDRGQDEWPE
jgi:hypothetical protein